MVAISRKSTKRPPRQALWKIRLVLYGLSALALLFSVCLVFTDLIAQQQQQQQLDGNTMLFPSDNHGQHRQLAKENPKGAVTAGDIPQQSGMDQPPILLAAGEQVRPLSPAQVVPKEENQPIIASSTAGGNGVVGAEEQPPPPPPAPISTAPGGLVVAPTTTTIDNAWLAPAPADIAAEGQQQSPPVGSPVVDVEATTTTNDHALLAPAPADIPAGGQQQSPPVGINAALTVPEETLSLLLPAPADEAAGGQQSPPVGNAALTMPEILSLPNSSSSSSSSSISSTSPAVKMFVLVADSRAASDWILSRLDLHPAVCASSDTGGLNNGEGYPLGCLLPSGMPWLQDADPRQGCILAFIRPHVKELIRQSSQENNRWNLPPRCQDGYDAQTDPLQVHLPRLCAFAKTVLEGYNTSTEAAIDVSITHAYMKAFMGDRQELLACKCPVSTKVRGLKVLTDWIPSIHGFLDRHEGVRVLRLYRRNTLARYLSFQAATKTNIWQTRSAEEKHRQVEALPADWTIDVNDMLESLTEMEGASAEADQWAEEHAHDAGRDVYSIEYEDCRDRPEECFVKIFQYLGIEDGPSVLESNKNNFLSTFKDSASANPEHLLDKMTNQELVREVLSGSNYGSFIGPAKTYRPIQHIQLHTHPHHSIMYNHHLPFVSGGLNRTSVYWEGTGPKFQPVLDVLRTLPADDLAAISLHDIDSVVMINPLLRSSSQAFQATSTFRSAVRKLADQHKIVLSTTDVCCAAALSHAQPGSLVGIDPESHKVVRKDRACASGSPTCAWVADEDGQAWKNGFESMAMKAQKTSADFQIFPDGSLMAGAVSDLLDLLQQLDIGGDEDERAVLTDFIMQDPDDKLQLDYDSSIVQRQPADADSTTIKGCFEKDVDVMVRHLLSTNMKQTLFVRTERRLGCGSNDTVTPIDPVYPSWGNDAVLFQAILNHIDDLLLRDKSMNYIDRHFGKEIAYVVTDKGILGSQGNREKFRTLPTEKLAVKAFEILKASLGSGVWPDLEKVVSAGGFPYFAWYGDYRGCNYHNKGDDSIPLFTTSATIGCMHAFPAPSYMSIINAQTRVSGWLNYFQRFDKEYPWSSKIRKVFWRGTLSESDPAKVQESIRWRVSKFVADRGTQLYDLFDVGLTEIPDYVISMAGITASEAGGLKNEVKPMINFQKYLAILDMDGNSWSSRFSNLLCYNSVVLKVEPGFVDDFFYHLVPWRHYIPVKNSLQDLEEKAQFVVDPNNEHILREIVYNANLWCSEHLLQDRLARDQVELWEKYVKLLNKSDEKWQTAWLAKRDAVVSADGEYGMVALR